jgi:O-antigen ligase
MISARVWPAADSRVRSIAADARVLMGSVLAIVVAAPFERPLLSLPWASQTLTTSECVVLAALALGAAAFAARRTVPIVASPITVPGVALLAAFGVAAAWSPVDQAIGVKLVLRLSTAALVFVLTMNAVTTTAQAQAVMAAFLAVATVVALLGILEAQFVPAIHSLLQLFRPAIHVVGGAVRATSTLIYPTIASMYLEVAFALGLGVLLARVRLRSGVPSAAIVAALAIIGAGIAATFTRSGLIAMATSLLLVGALHYARVRRLDRTHALLLAVAASVVAGVALSRSTELLRARALVEGGAWYGAVYAAPPRVTMRPREWAPVLVTVRNTGRLTWQSDSEPLFLMAHHWMHADGRRVIRFEGARTKFPRAVPPGASITLPAYVEAPGYPGEYVIAWDVVHEHRTWLSVEGVEPGYTTVTVSGPAVSAAPRVGGALPTATTRPGRLELWSAALGMARERPLLGHGPDTFRLSYGRYLNLEVWDTRVHANNMYLDVLAGAGLAGLAALVWLLAASGLALWRRWRAATPAMDPLVAAAAAAWLAVAGHGLVDSFLSFSPTYLAFAVVSGVAFSPALAPAERSDAHRV